jgi:rhomboid family GlyGly-CTERM serine protease
MIRPPGPRTDYGGPSPPWCTLAVAGSLLALYGLLGPAPEVLLYDRAAIRAGEYWRLLSGHLVHLDAGHLAWNLAAFVVLGGLAESALGLTGLRFLAVLLLGAVAIDVWLTWGLPALSRYCGFSGLLNVLMAANIVAAGRRTCSPLAGLIAAGALAKIALEATAGSALFAETLWPPVPSAHGAGFLAGLLVAWAWRDHPGPRWSRMVHFGIDLSQTELLARVRIRAQLHVRPVLEALPMTARRQSKPLGLLGVDSIAVVPVDLAPSAPLGAAVDQPEAVHCLAPLMP